MISLPQRPAQVLLPIANSLRRTPLLFVSFTGIGGVVAADGGHWFVGCLLAAGFIAGSFFLRGVFRPLRAILWTGALVMIVTGAMHTQERTRIHRFPLATALAKGQTVAVKGEGWITDIVVRRERSISTTVQLDHLTLGGQEIACDHRVPAWIHQLPPGLKYGDRIEFTGQLIPLKGPQTPGGFDAKKFYYRQNGSLGSLEVEDGDSFSISPVNSGNRLISLAFQLRSYLEAGLLTGISGNDETFARLIGAMTLGAKENSPADLEELFRISGTMHLFAVSGLHVGIVAGLLIGAAALLRIPRHFAVLLVIPAILFYAVLTGLSPSAVRAALMLSALLSAYAVREKPRLLNSLGFACLVILLFETRQVFLPGFQLSFSVLLFLALFGTAVRDALARPLLIDPFLPRSLISPLRYSLDRLSGAITAALAISLVAWLGSAGILAWHFQNISMVGIFANLLMVPIASLMIGVASFSLAAFGLRLVWLNLAANKINVGIAMTLTGLAQFFANLPGATFNTGDFLRASPGNGAFTLDVMGDRGEAATLITIPRGPHQKPLLWMIDCGGPHTYRNQVLPLLRSRGINRIDALILTHGDQGHIGAAPDLITQFRPAVLFEGAVENRSPVHDKILEAADTFGSRIVRVGRGDRMAIGDHALATILSPSPQEPGRLADDRALVLKLQWDGFSLLFTSDIGFHTEQELLQAKADLRADLWIRGQHSESPGALPGFVDALNPQAVISSNAEFPTSEQIPDSLRKSLQEKGIPLFDLSACGTTRIEIRSGLAHISGYTSPEPGISFSAKSQ